MQDESNKRKCSGFGMGPYAWCVATPCEQELRHNRRREHRRPMKRGLMCVPGSQVRIRLRKTYQAQLVDFRHALGGGPWHPGAYWQA